MSEPIRNRIYTSSTGGVLWVGRHPQTDPAVDGIDLLLLCATHLQDHPPDWKSTVYGYPLHDDVFELVKGDAEGAEKLATVAATWLRDGHCVMTTCKEGLNRSGWVAAWAMVKLGMAGDKAIENVQANRNGSLYNYFFRQHLLEVAT